MWDVDVGDGRDATCGHHDATDQHGKRHGGRRDGDERRAHAEHRRRRGLAHRVKVGHLADLQRVGDAERELFGGLDLPPQLIDVAVSGAHAPG